MNLRQNVFQLTIIGGAILASAAAPGRALAQGGMSGPAQAPNMKVMMGVPLPFGIMIGRAEQWMVGYQYMFDHLNGILDGANAISETDVLARFQTTRWSCN